MSIYIIILHYSPSKELQDYTVNLTLASLKSVINSNYKNLKIILIDNSENLNFPVEKLEELGKESIVLIKNKKNTGFAEGCNIGIKMALKNNADYIFLLNNDAIVYESMFDEFLKYAEDEKVDILGGKIYYADNLITPLTPPLSRGEDMNVGLSMDRAILWYAGGKIDWLRGRGVHIGQDIPDNEEFDTVMETDFVTGCAIFIKRKVFETIGLLDEKYFLYFEDVDFCVRAKKAGFKIKYIPSAKIEHIVSATTKKESPLSIYYQNRNRLIFMRTHTSIFNVIVFFILYFLGFIRRIVIALLKKDNEKFEANIKAFIDGLIR